MIEIESIITLALVGFSAGFFFSIPVAGPVSIIITSHAIKGDRHFAFFTAMGAAIVDIIYCFIAVFGFTQLYSFYEPYIPITLFIGGLFLFYIGYKVRKTTLDLDHFDEQKKLPHSAKGTRRRGKFLTGLTMNFLNPSLFIGWLTSSFFVLSLAASLGMNVGGLNTVLENNVETFNGHEEYNILKDSTLNKTGISGVMPKSTLGKEAEKSDSSLEAVLKSASYALSVGLGSVVWFYFFSGFLVRNRKKLKIHIINKIIHGLSYALWIFSIYLIYEAVNFWV